MSDFGLISKRFDSCNLYMQKFNEAIELFRNNQNTNDKSKINDSISNVLAILRPIAKSLKGDLSNSFSVNEQNIIDILRQKYKNNWQSFKQQISELTLKVEKGQNNFSTTDIQILDDVADAIDAECAHLFRRISSRS